MEEGYIDTDLLNEAMCEDKHGHYQHSKWIDCYCKPEDHIGKVGGVFPIVIRPEFRTRQYRDNDHREDASHFKTHNNPKMTLK